MGWISEFSLPLDENGVAFIDPQGMSAHAKSCLPEALVVDLYLYDGLPRAVRWALQECIIPLRAQPFGPFFAHVESTDRLGMLESIAAALGAIEFSEMDDQRRFATKYWLRYHDFLPHLAAKATIQRYGERG